MRFILDIYIRKPVYLGNSFRDFCDYEFLWFFLSFTEIFKDGRYPWIPRTEPKTNFLTMGKIEHQLMFIFTNEKYDDGVGEEKERAYSRETVPLIRVYRNAKR